MYRRVSRAIRRWEGLSTDIRPTHDSIVAIGALLHELDTGNNFQWDGDEWVQYEPSFLKIKNYLLNTETWEWEASTKGTGVGEAVSVENFPAVISGVSVPVSGILSISNMIPAVETNLAKDGSLSTINSTIQNSQPREISKAVIPFTIALAASGNVKIPSSGKRLRIYSIQFSLSSDLTDVAFRWTSGGSDFMKVISPKTGGYYGKNTNNRYTEGGIDEVLYCNITGAGTIQVNIDYVET